MFMSKTTKKYKWVNEVKSKAKALKQKNEQGFFIFGEKIIWL